MVNIPPLVIIQARHNSSRLPGKMLLKLGDETLIERAVRVAGQAFFSSHVVVAIPANDENGPLGNELRRIGARIFAWAGAENDVLGRFYACAHLYRWHPESVIVRYTPDDPWKDINALRRVADGWRMPVEIGGEAFTLAMLDEAYLSTRDLPADWITASGSNPGRAARREHITHALFPAAPPPSPNDGTVWTIDTQEDYDRACAAYAEGRR